MRRLLSLLTFIALLVAPLAAPAAAMATVRAAVSDCHSMKMGESDRKAPASHHRSGEPCCVGVPPAIDQPVASMTAMVPIDANQFTTSDRPLALGAAPPFDDPPPRST